MIGPCDDGEWEGPLHGWPMCVGRNLSDDNGPSTNKDSEMLEFSKSNSSKIIHGYTYTHNNIPLPQTLSLVFASKCLTKWTLCVGYCVYHMGWRRWDYVEKARPPLLFIEVGLSEKILLSMACHLGGCPSNYKIARDTPPVSFTKLLKPNQEHPMLILTPWHTCKSTSQR